MLCRFLEALDEPAFLLARSGVIRHANAATLRLLGCREPALLVGRPLSELAADPPEAVASLVRRFFATSASVIGSLQLRATTVASGNTSAAAAASAGCPRRTGFSPSCAWRTPRKTDSGC